MNFVRFFNLRLFFALAALWAAFVLSGCGYYLQNSHNEILDKEGIQTVYVKPLVNNTYKPGIENVVYNALIRTLLSHRRVKLVQSEAAADAVLQGSVSMAQFVIAGSTTANQLSPYSGSIATLPGSNLDISHTSVATVYSAFLGCDFSLRRRVTPPGKRTVVWSSSFSRSKPFAAANQLDVLGTTSALINESEFERALSEMATNMMDDLHESMLAMF